MALVGWRRGLARRATRSSLADDVERRDAVGLGERREVEDVLDERIDRNVVPISAIWATWMSSVAPSPTICAPRTRFPPESATSFRNPACAWWMCPRAISSKRARPTRAPPRFEASDSVSPTVAISGIV
jgi:hypothetical protein